MYIHSGEIAILRKKLDVASILLGSCTAFVFVGEKHIGLSHDMLPKNVEASFKMLYNFFKGEKFSVCLYGGASPMGSAVGKKNVEMAMFLLEDKNISFGGDYLKESRVFHIDLNTGGLIE